MNITTENSTTLNLDGGHRVDGKKMLELQAQIRPGNDVQIYVKVLDPAYAVANKKEAAKAVNEFLVQVFDTAAANGLPIIGGS